MNKNNFYFVKTFSSNFDEEISLIKEKFMKADYPLRFINSVVNEFYKGKECGDESLEFHLVCLKLQNLSYSLKNPM